MFSSAATATAAFVAGGIVSLAGSALLVSRIERLAGSLGVSEAILGLVIALAADSPEITSAVTASSRGQNGIGVGIVLGSNVFNLAALLGLGSLVAGRIRLHRRVVLFEGAFATWVALVSVLVLTTGVGAPAGLLLVLVVGIPYVVTSAVSLDTLLALRVPARAAAWLQAALREEAFELAAAIHPRRRGRSDVGVAIASLVAIIVASSTMEQAASSLGKHYNVPSIVVGGLVLAAVTSLPNAVGGIFLSKRGRGAALLSETMNSNALNVLVGLLMPAAFIGLGRASGSKVLVAGWYGGMTVLGLGLAYAGRGLGRRAGLALVAAYVAFVAVAVTL